MSGIIDDPIELVKYANKHINRIEEAVELAKADKDFQTVAKLEGHLLGWALLLEKALHQAFQQGKTTDDITKGFNKKSRVNA